MWSVVAFLLLVQQVSAGIFIPIHGYGKNVQKRQTPAVVVVERMCWQLVRNAEESVALGQRRESAYANIPNECYDYLQQQ